MGIRIQEFDREKHVYRSAAFEEIIKDTIRFFNGTPVVSLPPPEKFTGTGVYALYYIGSSDLYTPLYEANRMEYKQPIYVGKAVPSGWRQNRATAKAPSHELCRRLSDHSKSIAAASNLNHDDFVCRFMILEGVASDMIGTVEAALIRFYTPVWNSCIDGFGNHDPGSGRYNQARSDWDVLHPGREWADRCSGVCNTRDAVVRMLQKFWEECGHV